MSCSPVSLTITRKGSISGLSSGRQFQKVDENHPEVFYNRNRTAFYLRQVEDYSADASLSDQCEDLLWRSTVCSTVLHLVRTRTIQQVIETASVSINRGMGKEDVIYTRTYTTQCYSAIKKNKIMPFAATWTADLEIIIPSEVSHTEKDKYHMISLICGAPNMTQMNLYTKQKQTLRLREQACGCGGGEAQGRDGVGVWD